MDQEIKKIAPSKNAFQNCYLMDALPKCSLKKCHLKIYLIKENLTDEHK